MAEKKKDEAEEAAERTGELPRKGVKEGATKKKE